MKNVVALLNLHTSPELGLLTEKRPLASTPFLGRYAFMDFALSNLIHSGIDDIGVMIKSHSRSIIKHLGNENTYLKNTKTGFLNVMINEKGIHNPLYNTDINNVRENDYFLYDQNCKYVLVVPVGFVMRIDYEEVVREHIKSGRALSVVYCKVNNAGRDFNGLNKFSVDAIGNVQKVDAIKDNDTNALLSLNTYVISKPFFIEALKRAESISSSITMKELISSYLKLVEPIHAIEFKGEVRYFNSLKKYYDYSFEIKNGKEDEDSFLFQENWKFFTRTHDTRPVLYGENCDVKDSIISNGCTVYGTVKNSILSRNVIVEEGATVENSIIFSDCVIKSGIHVKNIVADKLCKFQSKKEVSGTQEEPLYIPQGEVI